MKVQICFPIQLTLFSKVHMVNFILIKIINFVLNYSLISQPNKIKTNWFFVHSAFL